MTPLKALLPLFTLSLVSLSPTSAVGDECKCHGCWGQTLNQITCPNGGNPPLIVPTFQTAGDNPCVLDPNCGTPADPKKCLGSFKVRVSFASPCPERARVWVQGGQAFPVPTEVNATTPDSPYSFSANCGETQQKIFKVWYAKPNSAADPHDASYTFTLTCHQCSVTDPCGDG